MYSPGVHTVRLNLLAHWDPEKATPLAESCDADLRGGRVEFAHGEVLSAYGVHRELFRMQDGRHLPYSVALGYQAREYLTQPWGKQALSISWNADRRRAELGTIHLLGRSRHMSAPVLVTE
jgi:hypothetical protein